MPVSRTYPEGVPSWVGLDVPDLDAATAFYGPLFGWTFEPAGPPATDYRFLVAQLDGADAAGLGSPGEEAPTWTTYIAVDDVDATAERVRAAGGLITREPVDLGPPGRMASCLDPEGAPFRLWQAGRRLGAQAVNVPGGWNFSDLHANDPDTAAAFYHRVFGYVEEELGGVRLLRVEGYGAHLAATADPEIYERQATAPDGFADAIGGLTATGEGETPHWRVVFSVADRDESSELINRHGGHVLSTSEDDWSRRALIRDPFGAEFGISQSIPPS